MYFRLLVGYSLPLDALSSTGGTTQLQSIKVSGHRRKELSQSCAEEKQFNKYNFDKKVWEIPQTLEPTKNNDGDDDEEEEDDVEEEDDEEEEDGSDDESDEETEESGKR
jgi:hypothetical protein